MVVVAQLVRVAVCGAAGRRFEPGQPPRFKALKKFKAFFVRLIFLKSYKFILDQNRILLRLKSKSLNKKDTVQIVPSVSTAGYVF